MLISHPKENNIPEKLLTEHLSNVAENIKNILENLELNLTLISKKELIDLGFNIGLFHDIGKATTFFQNYIYGKMNKCDITNHSLLSAFIAYFFVKDKVKSKIFAFIVYKIIKKHHGNLENLAILGEKDTIYKYEGIFEKQKKDIKTSKNFDELKCFYEKYDINFDKFLELDINFFNEFKSIVSDSDEYLYEFENNDEKSIELFFIENLLFSCLIDTDKMDAARLLSEKYFENNLQELNVNPINYIKSQIKKSELDKNIISLNKLRNEFLEEIKNNNEINKQNHFYTITAPTGIGKTFGCMIFADKLKKQLKNGNCRIIYCLPYTSIIDQNFDEFLKILRFNLKNFDEKPTKYILKHHHLTENIIENRNKKDKDNDNEYIAYKDYLDDKLFVESWQSSLIVTTFVQFFHSIISARNRQLKKLHNIFNSIIILDEVQNIEPKIYKFLQKVFNVLAEKFNIYFLFITATQPEILDKNKKIIEIIDRDKYMTDDVFNRVKLNVNLKNIEKEDFVKNFKQKFKYENSLIVMNTKKTVQYIYRELKNYYGKLDYKVVCLTTNLIPKDRKLKIEEIKTDLRNHEKIIVVSTQMIEAGVDVSFKYVVRNIGPIDSIIQVAGRCNRNYEYGELGGVMDLVNVREYNIYGQYILEKVEFILKKQNYESKEFNLLAEQYFKSLNFEHENKEYLEALCSLDYNYIDKNFKLIDERCYEEEVYVLTTQEAKNNMDRLLQLKEKIKNKDFEDKDLIELEKTKFKLKEYQIGINRYDIEKIKIYIKPENDFESSFYKYISYKDFKKVYDSEIGFNIKEDANLTL
ncbi:MAG: CRISPR-associated helicase Cas3' [Elusimicrobiota bacterium]|jgi:CRISPR-associated endonuclease/helicase Cas3|nr:CRISPR-associated helicase Cas3' [Elusimicrobiota bacterium]